MCKISFVFPQNCDTFGEKKTGINLVMGVGFSGVIFIMYTLGSFCSFSCFLQMVQRKLMLSKCPWAWALKTVCVEAIMSFAGLGRAIYNLQTCRACWRNEGKAEKRNDPGRTRTCNPRLRRPMPYPLGHGASCFVISVMSIAVCMVWILILGAGMQCASNNAKSLTSWCALKRKQSGMYF